MGPTQRSRVNADTVAGAVVLVFGLAYTVLALRIPPSSFTSAVVGPSVFPIAIGVGLILASAALLVKGLLVRPADHERIDVAGIEDPDLDDLPYDANPPQSPVKLAVVLVVLLGYVLTFVDLGYVVSTFLFLVILGMYLDRRHPVRNVVYAAAFPAVVYFIFTSLLGVTLPAGILAGVLGR